MRIRLPRCHSRGNWRSRRPSPVPYSIRRPQTFSIKINHLPKNVTEEELQRGFQSFGRLESIRICNGGDEDYAFLNYHDEHSVQRAVSEMNGCMMRGKRLSVLAQFGSSHHVQQQQFTVKVENLSKRTTEQTLEQAFRLGDQLSIRSSKVVDCYYEPVNYAYVNYTTKYEAETAVAQLHCKVIDGSMIKVQLHTKERACLPGVQSAAPMSYPPQGSSRITHQAAPLCPPHANGKSFSTLKVSIYGNELSPDDLEVNFTKYGPIIEKPIIQPGTPNFAYINFENPDSALAACKYFNSGRINIQGTHIAVKLHTGGKGLQEPQNIIRESVQCDSLVAKLIQAEAEKFIKSKSLDVTIKQKGTGGGLDIWGDLSSIAQVKLFVEYMVPSLEGAVGEERVSLHSLHIPAFANSKIVEILEELQKKHAFSLAIAGPPHSIPLREFHSIVAKELAVTGADSPQSYTSPQISTFLMFEDTPVPDPAQYEWLWENDSGDYALYPPDVCNQLSKHFAMPPSSREPCKIGPPMLPQSYTINVDALSQTNDKSKRQRKIMKREPPPTPSRREFVVVISAFNTSEPKALLRKELTKHTDTLKIDLPSTADEALKSCLLDITEKYFVKAQIDSTDSGEMVILEGVKEYVNRVELQLRQEILTHKSSVVARAVTKASATFETPDDWEPQTEKSELKTVTEKSSEWNRIQSHVHKTLPSAQIVKLERIQNQWLWDKYTFSKQRMIVKNNGDVNEKELFHGTRETLPEKIFKSEHGFDFRFSSKGMWGEGTYFAVNAQYSDDYAHSVGDSKQMILAKVLTGEPYRCKPNHSLKKPPVKKSQVQLFGAKGSEELFEDEQYDSVSGNTNGSDIFVIYDHEKAYPAYLITYKMARLY